MIRQFGGSTSGVRRGLDDADQVPTVLTVAIADDGMLANTDPNARHTPERSSHPRMRSSELIESNRRQPPQSSGLVPGIGCRPVWCGDLGQGSLYFAALLLVTEGPAHSTVECATWLRESRTDLRKSDSDARPVGPANRVGGGLASTGRASARHPRHRPALAGPASREAAARSAVSALGKVISNVAPGSWSRSLTRPP